MSAPSDHWACSVCSFHNKNSSNKCEMCDSNKKFSTTSPPPPSSPSSSFSSASSSSSCRIIKHTLPSSTIPIPIIICPNVSQFTFHGESACTFGTLSIAAHLIQAEEEDVKGMGTGESKESGKEKEKEKEKSSFTTSTIPLPPCCSQLVDLFPSLLESSVIIYNDFHGVGTNKVATRHTSVSEITPMFSSVKMKCWNWKDEDELKKESEKRKLVLQQEEKIEKEKIMREKEKAEEEEKQRALENKKKSEDDDEWVTVPDSVSSSSSSSSDEVIVTQSNEMSDAPSPSASSSSVSDNNNMMTLSSPSPSPSPSVPIESTTVTLSSSPSSSCSTPSQFPEFAFLTRYLVFPTALLPMGDIQFDHFDNDQFEIFLSNLRYSCQSITFICIGYCFGVYCDKKGNFIVYDSHSKEIGGVRGAYAAVINSPKLAVQFIMSIPLASRKSIIQMAKEGGNASMGQQQLESALKVDCTVIVSAKRQ